MYAKTPQITIQSDKGTLRLCLPRGWMGGTQKRIDLGLPDTDKERAEALLIAKEIELDYNRGQLKPLDAYKPQKQNLIQFPGSEHALDTVLLDLWDKYVQFRKT